MSQCVTEVYQNVSSHFPADESEIAGTIRDHSHSCEALFNQTALDEKKISSQNLCT